MVRPERPSPSLPLPRAPPPLQPRRCISKAGAFCQPSTPICTHAQMHAHAHTGIYTDKPARTRSSCSSSRRCSSATSAPLVLPLTPASLPSSHPLPETPAFPPLCWWFKDKNTEKTQPLCPPSQTGPVLPGPVSAEVDLAVRAWLLSSCTHLQVGGAGQPVPGALDQMHLFCQIYLPAPASLSALHDTCAAGWDRDMTADGRC